MNAKNSLDELFTMNCGKCGQRAPLDAWIKTEFGELPRDHYQCPNCHYAFKRTYHAPKDTTPTMLHGANGKSFLWYPSGHITLDAVQSDFR